MSDERFDPEMYKLAGGGNQGSSFITYQIDTKQEIEDFRAELLGLEWDENKQEYVKSKNKIPLVNEVGANAILATLNPRVTKIFSLSNHQSEDIDVRCKRYLDGLTYMLVRHQEIYGIPSYAVTDIILDLCDDIFRATLLKSIGGWEGSGIRGQQQYQEVRQTITDDRNQEKKPFWTLPFNNNKGRQ